MRSKLPIFGLGLLMSVWTFAQTGAGSAPVVTDEDRQVAQTVHAYWVNFAEIGNPNGQGLTNWPRYEVQKDVILDFRGDGTQAAVPDPWKARLDLAEHLSNTTPVR